MFRCGQWADNTPWFSSRGCIQPELPAAGREQRRSPPGEHESSLDRRAPGGKRGPAVGGGSAGAGTAARRAPPRPAWRHGIPGRSRQWRRGHVRGHPRQGSPAPPVTSGLGHARPPGRVEQLHLREQLTGSAASSSASPAAGTAKADRDSPWIVNLRAAPCAWEPVLPS